MTTISENGFPLHTARPAEQDFILAEYILDGLQTDDADVLGYTLTYLDAKWKVTLHVILKDIGESWLESTSHLSPFAAAEDIARKWLSLQDSDTTHG